MNNNHYFDINRRMAASFGLNVNEYFSLDKETQLLLERAYWDIVNKRKSNEVKGKTKVLSIFKRK